MATTDTKDYNVIGVYLQDVGKFPLLSREEEKETVWRLYTLRQSMNILCSRTRFLQNIHRARSYLNSKNDNGYRPLGAHNDGQITNRVKRLVEATKEVRDSLENTSSRERIRLRDELSRLLQIYADAIRDKSSEMSYLQEILGIYPGDLDDYKARFNSALTAFNQTREDFINHNLRLVISMANTYLGRGVTRNDLIQEGNLALMWAVEKFNPERGNRFSTYATHWIRQAMIRATVEQSTVIAAPTHVKEEIGRLLNISNKYGINLIEATMPELEDIARELSLPVDRVVKLAKTYRVICVVSIDSEIHNSREDPVTLKDLVESQECTPEEELMRKDGKDMVVYQLLKPLTPRERSVVELRFGLYGGEKRTLKEVGKVFGVTRERIRQIEKTALLKMKSQTVELGLE